MAISRQTPASPAGVIRLSGVFVSVCRSKVLPGESKEIGLGKDLIVWIGCVVLVFVGILLGQAPLSSHFFQASNVHDFFDIVGAIATCAAVIVAASGLKTWKNQVKSTADIELARRVAIALERYKTKLNVVWVNARAAAYFVEADDYLDEKLAGIAQDNFTASLDGLNDAGVELRALALECKAIWGDVFEADLAQLFMFASMCDQCIYTFLRIISPTSNDLAVSVAKGSFSMYWKTIDIGPISSTDQAAKHVDNFFTTIASKLSVKLLR